MFQMAHTVTFSTERRDADSCRWKEREMCDSRRGNWMDLMISGRNWRVDCQDSGFVVKRQVSIDPTCLKL